MATHDRWDIGAADVQEPATPIATGAAFAVGRVLPLQGKLMTLAEAVIVGITYLTVLVITRELGKSDLQAIRAVRAKRGTAGDEP